MRKFLFSVISGFFLFFNFSYAGVNLSGTVKEISTSGESPVSGANLQVLGTQITDISGENGSFTLSNVPYDSFGISIKASKSNYKTSYTMLMGVGEEDETDFPVMLISNFVYNFVLHGGDAPSHISGKGDILGMVDAESVSGVSIQARYIDDNSPAGTVMYINDSMSVDDSMTSTGTLGVFIIYNVDPERPVQIFATSGGTFSSAIAIAYPDSLTFAGLFQTSGNVNVNGSVKDEEENSVSDVNVSVCGLGNSAVSGTDGSFTLTNLPDFSPGIIKLSKTGYKDTYFEGFIDSEEIGPEGLELFILSDSAYQGFLNSLGITHTSGKGDIGGSVGEGGEIAGASVKLYDKNGNQLDVDVYYFDEDGNPDTSLTSTSSDGGFVIPNLDPGFYYLTATKPDFEFQIVGIQVFADGISIVEELINWPPIQFLYKNPPQGEDTQVETSNIAPDDVDVPILKFDLFVDYPDIYYDYFQEPKDVIINSIKFTPRGTGNPQTSLSSAKLYYSSDGISYTLAGTASTITQNEILFENINIGVNNGKNNFWLLKFDFNGNANQGDTFAADILKNADITATDSQTGRDVTCHGEPVIGNLMTIVSPPEKPTNISPANGATNVDPTNYTLQASLFDPGEGHPLHSATQWYIRKADNSWSWDSGEVAPANTIENPTPLENSKVYYWKVRYKNGDGIWSDWSDETWFTTMGIFIPPDKPTNISPVNGAVDIDPRNCILESSEFSGDEFDYHYASQWQITETPGNYTNPVFDSGPDNENLTQITIPVGYLSYNKTYYWRVRHMGGAGGWSDWSDETSFTTQTRAPGDINGDGNVDISDVILCLRMAIGLDTPDPSVADMNDDGVVDISDVILVLRKAIGLD